MSINAETALTRPDESEPWRACLRDRETGEILGAGVVLTGGAVLTCAHVVQRAEGYVPGAGEPEVEITVELAGGGTSAVGRVLRGCWAPPHDDRADLALLSLNRWVGPEPGAQLRRLRCPRNRSVHAYGFPHPHKFGVYASAVLSGRAGPGGEWIQIDPVPQRELIRPGFSGAGVVDDRTGAVVGIAAMVYDGDPSHLAWMIPIDVIAEYLPAIRKWLSPDVPCDRWVPSAGAILIAIGQRDEAAEAGIKVAKVVDATGKSANEVFRVIHGEPAMPSASEPSASEPLGVAGIEQAQEPEEVLDGVVGPLVQRGATVVLRFSDEDSVAARLARQRQRNALRVRLDALTEGIADLEQREDLARLRRRRIQAKLLPPPEITELPALSAELQLPLAVLRGSLDEQHPTRLQRAIDRYERKLGQSLDLVDRVTKETDAAMLEHERLHGLLVSYNARAVAHGLLEDQQLDGLLHEARTALGAHPCELAVAEKRVDDYVREVRRRIGGGQG